MPQQQKIDPDSLPKDAVALTFWTVDVPNQMTVMITRWSWDVFCDQISKDKGIDPKRTYEFVTPSTPAGRKGKFFVHGLVIASGNYHSGIVS